MSIVVDEQPITETQEFVTEEVTSEESVESTPIEDTAVEAEPTSEIPEKYAGKSIEDIIEMHENATKKVTQQGQELSEQRKLMQEILETQRQSLQQQTQEPVEETVSFEDTFYENPEKAIASLINNNEDIKRAREVSAQASRDAALSKLESTYPDYKQIVGSTPFLDWVGQSPVRKSLLQNAHTNWDFDAASELISTWKQVSMVNKTNEVKEEQKKSIEKALKQSTTEKRTTGDSVGGKRIYRRADLQRMQMYEPDRYASLQDEIYKAYQEGRVK
jgi:DNA-binding transcriptional MerR regulator